MTRIFEMQDVHCPFSATIELIERHQDGSEHAVGPLANLRTRVVCDLRNVRDFTDEARIHEALILHWKARANFDLFVGRLAARRTLHLFLAELRTYIEAEWQKERASYAARAVQP